MNNTKKEKKKGCILLLGNKGGVGITYHDCDVTISLDDGHNLDNQRQRYSRALTEGLNKTIGINVDMNIQRTYLFLNDVIHKHRTNTKTTKTNGEILKYLYEHNIFLFNPSDINNGKVKTFEITEYYNKEAENILNNIDDTNLLNDITVVDDDIILDNDEIGLEFNWNETTNQLESYLINPDLEGEQQNCPKGSITKYDIEDKDDDKSDTDELTQVEEDKIEKQKQNLKELCKRILFPLLALLSRTFIQLEFKEMLFHNKTKEIVNGILKDKKIILNKNLYNSIIKIMENNNEIINNIREIYRTAPANKIHQLIAKHFIPSIDEKKKNAEIPTPILLVEEMLNTIPEDFWKTPKKVGELCCGKGNFVMKIFEKFYIGLQDLYPDENKRCKIIITKCLYFADLTPMNVFITTEILKCEIQSKTGIEEISYSFNSYVGDTLKLNIVEVYKINKFNAIIGNPPYNPDTSLNNAKGQTLWPSFVKCSINMLIDDGLLLYVHPPNWRKPNHELHNLIFNKLKYLKIFSEKVSETFFHCKLRVDYYLLCNNNNNKITHIIDEKNEEYKTDVSQMLYIPNYGLSIHNKISNLNIEKLLCINPRSHDTTRKFVNKIENTEYKYKLLNTISSKGITYYYSSKIHPNQNTKKVMFSNGRYIYPIYDDGILGGTQSVLFIEVNNELEGTNLIKYINSNFFKFLIKTTKFNNFAISHEFISIVKNISNYIEDINDTKINNYLSLTTKEIETINNEANKIENCENQVIEQVKQIKPKRVLKKKLNL